MGLRARLKKRLKKVLGRNGASKPFDADVWSALQPQTIDAFTSVHDTLDATWKVAADELFQALRETKGSEQTARELSELFAAAATPLQTALSAPAWTDGNGWTTAAAPLAADLRALGAELESGWSTVVTDLQPVFAAVRLDSGDAARLEGVGAELRSGFDDAARGFTIRQEGLDTAVDPAAEMRAAVELWRSRCARHVEVVLDGARGVLAEAAWLSRDR